MISLCKTYVKSFCSKSIPFLWHISFRNHYLSYKGNLLLVKNLGKPAGTFYYYYHILQLILFFEKSVISNGAEEI